MKRIIVTILAVAIAAVGADAITGTAQSLPSKHAVAETLKNADRRMALATPGAPSFHFVAKIRYTVGKKSVDGMYEFLWAAPNRYREEFRLGQLSATYLALRNKLYILRNTDVLTYPEWRVRMLTNLPASRIRPNRGGIAKVYVKREASMKVTCADYKPPNKNLTECFQPLTGKLVSIEHKVKKIRSSLAEDDFIYIGNARYPGHMLSVIGNERLDVRVQNLEVASRFGSDVFAPPPGATAYDWCATPDIGKQKGEDLFSWWSRRHPITGPTPASFHLQAYYANVAPDGRIDRLAMLYQNGSSKDVSLKTVSDVRFPVHSCGGTPVEYETDTAIGALIP